MTSDITRLHQIIEHWAIEFPDQLAAIDHDGRQLSYREFGVAVDAAEHMLRAADLRAGDRALLIAENSAALVAMILACSRIDAWAVPVNARSTAAELIHIQQHAEPRAIVFTVRASTAASEHAGALGATTVRHADLDGIALLGKLDANPEPTFEAADEQVAILIYTTGTMGAPKGVMVSHANALHNIAVNTTIRGLSSLDHIYPAPPHTHIFALLVTLASLSIGATVTFLPRFNPHSVFAALAGGVTGMPAVPAMYNKLLEYAERHAIKTPVAPSLRYISAGGAPLDPGWKRRVEAFFGLPLQNGYGMTEATPIITSTRFDQCRDDVSVGYAAPGVEVKIAPLPGSGPGGDEVGEILCKGPNVMLGYYRNPDETAMAIDRRGYLHTGDLGCFASDGSLSVVGRTREVIIRSGFNVYPGEVETALNQHPSVNQSAVVGRSHGDGDEEVLAFVECKPGGKTSPLALKAHLERRLTAYKRPRHILIVEQLPAAPTGKLLKSRMLEIFAGRIAELDQKN